MDTRTTGWTNVCSRPKSGRLLFIFCKVNTETENNSFPKGLNNAFLFAVFNALSFQIVLSSPMVLYAKTLDASATVLGIIVGMMPLLVIFQIPAANYVHRIGYKRFVYGGWGTRVLFIFGMALVPLTGVFLAAESRLALLLMLLFCFNLSRGISSCAWLPWITALVPPNLRGKYLVGDAAYSNFASFLTFVVAAFCLGEAPQPWRFSVLFVFSALMGATSLIFLKRIPDVSIPDEVRTATTRVPWLEMIRYAPFQKLLKMVAGWSVAYGGITAFTVAYLKVEAGMSEKQILLVTSVMFLGGLSSLWFLGSRLDRLGSKPVLSFSFILWILILGGWLALAGRLLAPRLPIVLVLELLMGLFAALVQMANTRLAMAVIPVMGRNHFFAIYSVLGSVCLGLAPIAWGLLIDAVGSWKVVRFYLEWNRFSVFFAAAGAVFFVAFILARRLHEPEAISMEALLRDILIQSPQRVWLRLWPRP
ncbi:MAG: Major Facilitator Superfamily protein [Pedosphaera sp.]|nr:Major Facilitator Superfamily protein [Pedosphaera sp.]